MKRSPLKRKTPLRRTVKAVGHTERRRETLAAALWRDARDAALERDHYECRALAMFAHECDGRLEVHHLLRRSQGGTHDLSNLLSLCSVAHQWVHANPADAYRLGLLRRRAA